MSAQHFAGTTETGDFYTTSMTSWKPGGAWASACPALATTKERGACAGGKGVYYHRYYPWFVEPLRMKVNMNMLEIGLDAGGSLELWKSYFPHANIFGTDIEPKEAFAGGRVKIFKARQEDTSALGRMVEFVKTSSGSGAQPFDFIIDDGSHWPSDISTTFEYLFMHGLKPGGVYAIEDLSTSYGQFDGVGLFSHFRNEKQTFGRGAAGSFVEYLKEFADLVNRRVDVTRMAPSYNHKYRDVDGQREPSTELADWVSMVSFGQSIAIVVKKTVEEHAMFPYTCNASRGDVTWRTRGAKKGKRVKALHPDVCVN